MNSPHLPPEAHHEYGELQKNALSWQDFYIQTIKESKQGKLICRHTKWQLSLKSCVSDPVILSSPGVNPVFLKLHPCFPHLRLFLECQSLPAWMQKSRGDSTSPWYILHLLVIWAMALELASRFIFHSYTEFLMKLISALWVRHSSIHVRDAIQAVFRLVCLVSVIAQSTSICCFDPLVLVEIPVWALHMCWLRCLFMPCMPWRSVHVVMMFANHERM